MRTVRNPAHRAAALRERVYGGITCLSTLLVLAGRLGDPLDPWAAVLDLVIATGGIWAASLFAEYVSHLALYETDGERADVRLLLRASGQILEAGRAARHPAGRGRARRARAGRHRPEDRPLSDFPPSAG